MIRKLASGKYRLYSRTIDPKTGRRRNLGTFDSRALAEKHEQKVRFFKRDVTGRRAKRRLKSTQRKNVVTARAAWQRDPSPARAAKEEGRGRAEAGTRGSGDFYHVQVRPKGEFRAFRTQDVGKQGGIERVAGRRADGSWSTQKWLIGREHAHVEDGRLVGDTPDARKVLDTLSSVPRRVRGDRFEAGPRSAPPRRRRIVTQAAERQERRLARRAHGDRPPPPGAPRS